MRVLRGIAGGAFGIGRKDDTGESPRILWGGPQLRHPTIVDK